jgi:dolichol-phosphate mannosyltransferase
MKADDGLTLSVVIPAQNEADSIVDTIQGITKALRAAEIPHEIIVVDDASTDGTPETVEKLSLTLADVRCLRSPHPEGFGFAVRAGLESFTGDAVAIVMADGSDSPSDLVRYYHLIEEGWDCAFGSRFIRGGSVDGYPPLKLVINRLANAFIRVLFRHGYNDTTNAFKAYRRDVIATVHPLLSNHFNLTVELPLKAVVRGHSYVVVPISWKNRSAGGSKLRLPEMGSRYLFIVLYALLEHYLSRGDYRRTGHEGRRPRLSPGVATPGAARDELPDPAQR